MTKVGLQSKTDLLTQELEFIKFLFEAVRRLLLVKPLLLTLPIKAVLPNGGKGGMSGVYGLSDSHLPPFQATRGF